MTKDSESHALRAHVRCINVRVNMCVCDFLLLREAHLRFDPPIHYTTYA